MSVKRCLVVERGAVLGEYFNPDFAQSPLEVKKLLKALPALRGLDEPRRFELLPRNPLEEHLHCAFSVAGSTFAVLLTRCGEGGGAPETLFAPVRAFLADEDAHGRQYAPLTRFLHEHFARLQAVSAAERKVDMLRQSLDAIREKTRESFQKIVSRGRDLEEMRAEAETLAAETHGFERASCGLRRELQRKRRRQAWLSLFVSVCALFALYVLLS